MRAELGIVLTFLVAGCATDKGIAPTDSGGEAGETGAVEDSGADSGDDSGDDDACDPAPPLTSFITREGDLLLDDGVPFRFVSVNVPDLLGIVDPAWAIPTPWEQADALCAVRQLGGKVARTYVISVGDAVSGVPRHVTAPGELDEEQMVSMDYAIAAAGEQGVRLIIPLVDQWSWVGGIGTYASFRGKSSSEFWTDATLIADFEETIRQVVGRVNTVTGVPYADDPAILAWETGNELDAPAAWTAQIAATIKDLDGNHLVLDGTYGIEPENLENEDIDVVSNHYYWPYPYADDYAAAAADDRAITKGIRPFIVGEFGLVSTDRVEALLDEVVDDGSAGVMVWSLRFHDETGGFYWHTEYDDGSTIYAAYHWPGFDSGEAWDEREVLALLAEAAARLDAPSEPLPPPAPEILAVGLDGSLHWRGSAGAASYTLERALASDGPWEEVERGFHDAVTANDASVADPSRPDDGELWYRMIAEGEGGQSAPSAVYGPVGVGELFTDALDDLGQVYSADTTLTIDSSNAANFDGDSGRVTRSAAGDASLVWAPGGALVSGEIFVWAWPHEPVPELDLATSPDGSSWTELSVSADDLGGGWTELVYLIDSFPADARYLRVTLLETGGNTWTPQIGKVDLIYRP